MGIDSEDMEMVELIMAAVKTLSFEAQYLVRSRLGLKHPTQWYPPPGPPAPVPSPFGPGGYGYDGYGGLPPAGMPLNPYNLGWTPLSSGVSTGGCFG